MIPQNDRHEGLLSDLPLLVLFPHSRCDCRCLMCDIWRDQEIREIGIEEVKTHLDALRRLRVRWIVLSGGEPLLHADLFSLCDVLRESGIRVTLLSTGLRLGSYAEAVATRTDDTILSLDGPELVHDQIRRVKGAYASLAAGTAEVRKYRPKYPFACRTTIQRANFRYLRETIVAAHQASFDSISFLAADLTSTAFNRPNGWDASRQNQIALSGDEVRLLEEEIEAVIHHHAAEIQSGFVRETPEKLRRIVRHFQAHLGEVEPVAPRCNAPWNSAVIESDGSVRPCFFHKRLGNIRNQSLPDILNGSEAVQFREELDVARDPICRRCVCSLYWQGGVG
jgi:radical SAM protein with 4Fe4S-binding SPASM domain